MNAGDMPAAKLDKVKAQVLGACASKIPEEIVKDGFAKGCVGKNARDEDVLRLHVDRVPQALLGRRARRRGAP